MVVFFTIISIIGIGCIYMWMEAHKNQVKEQTLYFTELPSSFKELKLFFISDIHRRIIHPSIIDKVKGKADIVIIGGDLVEKGVPLSKVKENITQLKKIGPVYFVWGNNDYEVDHHELDATLLDQRVKILDNTAVTFESDTGDRFVLLGVDDVSKKRDRIDLALQDSETGFRVLVSHDPKIISKVKKQHQISLVLSGHTHGGQIRIFGWGLYKKGGIRKMETTTLFVSNGYGTTMLPLRLGVAAETHLLILKPQSSEV